MFANKRSGRYRPDLLQGPMLITDCGTRPTNRSLLLTSMIHAVAGFGHDRGTFILYILFQEEIDVALAFLEPGVVLNALCRS